MSAKNTVHFQKQINTITKLLNKILQTNYINSHNMSSKKLNNNNKIILNNLSSIIEMKKMTNKINRQRKYDC